MKLQQAFIKLPVRYDAHRLAAEIAAFPESAWASHPNGFAGNSAARLITVDGTENDTVGGPMSPTEHLRRAPYLQQVLASFNTVWSRSRLMRLAPGADVPEHSDVNYHWFNRVRLHIPIVTRPEVKFHCEDEVVHMAAGEAWIFDNWRQHRVENRSNYERIHLVADTTGSTAFWQLAAAGLRGDPAQFFAFDPGRRMPLLLERFNSFRVMSPPEVDYLLRDLMDDLEDGDESPFVGLGSQVQRFCSLLDGFRADWRQIWLLHGDGDSGLVPYKTLLKAVDQQARALAGALRMRSNKVPVHHVMKARILDAAMNERHFPMVFATSSRSTLPKGEPKSQMPIRRRQSAVLDRPVFIVAAPRSGSTFLFETLAQTPQLLTLGGEAHWLVEGLPQFVPGTFGADSNRLTAASASESVANDIETRLLAGLKTVHGTAVSRPAPGIRFLEKTPKNSLRIPFFDTIFPDALFIHLWRDPRENVSSIIDAWRAGGWVTYSNLPDWDGPWSLLLPPGYQRLRGRPIEEVAAFQWRETNRIILNDLAALAPERHIMVRYDRFVADPVTETKRLCAFMGIQFDALLNARTSGVLPESAYTLTEPSPEKWRKNAAQIERILPLVTDVEQHLQTSS